MDRLDIAIFRELVQEPASCLPFVVDVRRSLSSIARKLGVDAVTIMNRLNRLHESGFIGGWMVALNPSLLGLGMSRVRFSVSPASLKNDVVEKIGLIDGVLEVTSYLGDALRIHLYYESEERLKERLRLISRTANSEELHCSRLGFRRPSIRISRTDLEIVRCIQHDPKKRYGEIASEVGASTRTVRRRLSFLNSERALLIVPLLNPRSLEGNIIADLLVSYSEPQMRADVNAELASYVNDFMLRQELSEDCGFFQMVLPGVGKIKEILKEAQESQGVAASKVDIVEDCAQNCRVVENQVGRAMEVAAN